MIKPLPAGHRQGRQMLNRMRVGTMLAIGSLWGCSFSDVLGHGELDAELGGASSSGSASSAGVDDGGGSLGNAGKSSAGGAEPPTEGGKAGAANANIGGAGSSNVDTGAGSSNVDTGGAGSSTSGASGAGGAGGSGSVDPGECSDGATEQQPCGIVQSGVRVRHCVDGQWGTFEGCSAPVAVQVASGNHHTCVLLDNGQVRCFGSNEQGQSDAPQGAFKQVAALDNRSCALSVDNQPICWGAESAALPPGEYQYIGLGYHRCVHGLNLDGQVVFGECGQTQWPGTYDHYRSSGYWITSVELDGAALSNNFAGTLFAPEGRYYVDAVEDCGLQDNGDVNCINEPLPAGKYRALLSYDSLNMPICGLRVDGSIACRQGFNTSPVTSLPRADLTDSATLGPYHACAITQDGDVSCSGVYPRPALPTLQGFEHLFAGEGSMCGERADGSIACWGALELELSAKPGFVDVSVGSQVLCGIDAEGTATCVGESDNGVEDAPQDERFRAIDVSTGFACGVRAADGLLSCWGDPDLQGIPRRWTAGAGQGAPFDDVVTGNHAYYCAQGAAGLRCGFAVGDLEPVYPEVPELVDFNVAEATMCGLSAGGELFCRGFFSDLYSLPASERFVALGMSWPWLDVAPTRTLPVMCGLRADATSACYGWGADLRAVRHVPTEERFVDLALSNDFGCGLRADGSVRCWGGFDFGQHDPRALVDAD